MEQTAIGVTKPDVSASLAHFGVAIVNDENFNGIITDKVYETCRSSKNSYKTAKEVVGIFKEYADYELNGRLAFKIVSDIYNRGLLNRFVEEILNCETLKGKVSFDREKYEFTLKVHDGFVVKTDVALGKTYVNGKFYYDIEEQDLLYVYCGFVADDCVYVLYKKKRFLSFGGLGRNFREIRDRNKIEKFVNDRNVEMIFTNKEVLYKA